MSHFSVCEKRSKTERRKNSGVAASSHWGFQWVIVVPLTGQPPSSLGPNTCLPLSELQAIHSSKITKIILKIRKERGRKFVMQSECCFPMSDTNRKVSKSSSAPILGGPRFVVGNIENWCDGVEQGPENPAGVMRPCYLACLVLHGTVNNSV